MAVDVEKVLEKLGLSVVRLGRRFWAERCPVPGHSSHNPSHRWKNFFVRADGYRGAGLWHCYSCKAGGRLVELVMVLRGLEFRAARDWLMSVEEQAPADPVLRVRVELQSPEGDLAVPLGVEGAGRPLAEWNSVPRAYVRGRGVTDDQVARWGIGYALCGRLAGRIFLPIRGASGRLANYAARTFVGHETRYFAADQDLDRPDVTAMLGEHLWPEPRARATATVLVFEGGFNGLALERAVREVAPGRPPELAGLQGSDFTNPRKPLKLSTFGRVVVATDPDRAGEDAYRAVAAALSRRVEVVRMRYPSGEDADRTPLPDLAEALDRCLSNPAARTTAP